MSVWITGDIHGDMQIQRLSSKNWLEGKYLTKNDILIIAGDFGLIWDNNPDNRTEQYWINWLNQKKFTVCFIDGNHENHRRLSELSIIEKFNGKVGKINDNIYHFKRGEIYTIENKTFFCFGGAFSRDRAYRKINSSYWEEEIPSTAEQQYAVDNLNKYNNKVDYMITHTAPDTIIGMAGMSLDYFDPTTRFLEFLVKNNQFKQYYCGHLHIDKDILNYHILWDRIIQII